MMAQVVLTVLCVVAAVTIHSGSADTPKEALPPPCDNIIYCHGKLLHTIQMASLYHDSKTFVDMKMKFTKNETMRLFEDMMARTHDNPSRLDLERFVNETFEPPGSEFEDWDPSDWKPSPAFLKNISDPAFQEWGSELHHLWKSLGRKMKDEVKLNEEYYSIIYVPNPVIVPGGRFREFYYWDSYWIVRGLLLSEMYDTVRGMLANFVSIVERIGLIPNGGRVYYARRSQPPLLTPMVHSYVEKTHDMDFVKQNIKTLDKEFDFWMEKHTVLIEKDGKHYRLARFIDYSSGPRPESYREDIQSAQIFQTEGEKDSFYRELKAGAESGWDFSSRWFILNGTNKGNLTNTMTTNIIPVDLNSVMYWNAVILSDFHKKLNNASKALYYEGLAQEWLEAVDKVLWHEEVGVWLDYDKLNEVKRDYFYPTNLAPLWTGCLDPAKKEDYIGKVLKYLEKTRIMVNLGGIPTTLEHSGEQWDYPNAWPPLQYIMVIALDNSGDPSAKDLAFEITEKWVRSNYKAFNDTHGMYEKYDATVFGGGGGGGEYEVQLGFGWTNGVIMEFLEKYGERLTVKSRFEEDHPLMSASASRPVVAITVAGQVLTGILAFLVTVAAGCVGITVYRKRHQFSNAPDRQALFPKLTGGYMELRNMTFD
ncbi:trehalase-like [Thrips palmi]|uniref:Trehalase n=1 Tax=Thrips palmi TaxID=161013 RepID=A0A6P8Y4K9_THRPL|nr:trehalase-like [Thrips palmi]XP_034231437.1 trehalase-like [Thrips palmi]XP_034231505.1 trehalase-like [Thrips palmi]XP_034231588.1 trehalase-like [Thrips palmi]